MNNTRGTTLAIIGAIVGFAVIAWLHIFVFPAAGSAVSLLNKESGEALQELSADDNSLRAIASSANMQCPKQLDEATRMDSVGCPGNNSLAYYYTVSTITANPVDSVKLMANQSLIAGRLKAQSDVQYLAKLKVTMLYIFRDRSGRIITTMRITSNMYQADI
jgi:hypothetical protein